MDSQEEPFSILSRWTTWETLWSARFQQLAADAMQAADPGHGIDHVNRVVANAKRLGELEQADPFIVMPSAWLHDCILIAKNSPDRSLASRLAAAKARVLLSDVNYPNEYELAIQHAIESHSFSAAIECQTIEAKVVQDADRLEALGSIGIARCLMTAGSLGQALYNLEEPFPVSRIPDDRKQSIDHFFAKLFKLPATMKTKSGRCEADKRVDIMVAFLEQLSEEIGAQAGSFQQALQNTTQEHAPAASHVLNPSP